MNHPDDTQCIEFTAAQLLALARQMPCREAAKLLRGFLILADASQFPEIRALYQSLNDCGQQLDLLASRPIAIAA